jgi:hypothetical protein
MVIETRHSFSPSTGDPEKEKRGHLVFPTGAQTTYGQEDRTVFAVLLALDT